MSDDQETASPAQKFPTQAEAWLAMAKAAMPVEVRFDPRVEGVEVPPDMAGRPTAQILVQDFVSLRVDELGLHLPIQVKDAPDAQVVLTWESIWCMGSAAVGEAFFPKAAPLEVVASQFEALAAMGRQLAQMKGALRFGMDVVQNRTPEAVRIRWRSDVARLLGIKGEKPPLILVPGGR